MFRYSGLFIILLPPVLLLLTLANVSNTVISNNTINSNNFISNSIISNQSYSQVNTTLINTSYTKTNYKNISIIENGLPKNISWSVYINNFSDAFNSITPNSISIQNNEQNYSNILLISNISYGNEVFIPSIKDINISKFNSSNKILINYTVLKIIEFYEKGLPLNTSWNLSYGGIEKSSNSNLIIFKYSGTNNTFIIKNITDGNILYFPNKNEENLSYAYNTTINFSLLNISLLNKNTNITNKNNSIKVKNITAMAIQYNYSISNSTFSSSSNISKIIIPLFNNFNMSKGVFIKPLLISSKIKESLNSTADIANIKSEINPKLSNQNLNTNYNTSINSINTSSNSSIYLNYSIINNLTSLSNQQLLNFKNYIKTKRIPITQYNQTFNLSYGLIKQDGKFIPAGKSINLLTYNNQSTVSYYNISVVKAAPNMSIAVDGVSFNKTNSTGKIYVPVLENKKNYNLSISLKSVLGNNNYAEFSYSIKFNNGTTVTGSGNYNSVNKTFLYNLPYTTNAIITFDTYGNNNYSSVDPTLIVIPSGILSYVPITLSNLQNEPTPVPFQYMLPVNSLEFKSYESKNLSNIEFFYYNGSIIPSWMEGSTSNNLLNNPTNSIYFYTSTNTIYWLKLSNTIMPDNGITIYMGFSLTSQNLFNNVDIGEAPQLSPIYAEYDDGSTVFTYYNVNPSSSSGWTIHGTAGEKTAPSGSYYSSPNALYANSANGDYMYLPISGLSQNSIITFDVYTTGLGNLFFLTNSAGSGQMARLDGRGGGDYSGIATTSSWTSWAAPSPGIDTSENIWYKYDVVISSTTANAYIGSVSNYISTLGTLATSQFSIKNNGDYIGLVGDGLGSSHITYWNGFIIRNYPPNGVMPSASFGTPQSSSMPVIQIQNNPVAYGSSDIINGISPKSQDMLELFNDGVLLAGPTANVVTYTICGATPSISDCISPGSYTISVNDITSGVSTNTLLDVIQAYPSLKLNLPKVILNSGSYFPINYSISTPGNQIQSVLYIDGSSVSSSNSNNIYDFYPPTGNNLYNITLSSSGNGNYLSNSVKQDVCVVNTPSSTPYNTLFYAPLCILNNQTASVQGAFQQLISINESTYKNYLQYNGNDANFEIFNISGDVIPSWIENNNTGNLTIWVKLPYGISSNSIYPLYIGFGSNTLNLLSNGGINGIGEFPTATSTYAQYDNGNYVFNNYFNGGSLNGWTVAGTAGDTTSAPSGSPFGLNAFYANGANGDYLYTIANNQSENSIIEYYTYTQNLDDLFFLANSTGAGQIARVGNGAGWYGIAPSASWILWYAPPDTGTWSNEWLLMGLTITNGNAQLFLSTTPGTYGTEIGKNPSNNYSVTNKGDYLGFVGDAGSGTSTQYMNGLIIRAYPPNGVMPYVFQGSVFPVSSQSTCTISLNQNSITFGTLNPSSSINTINSIIDTNTGNTGAYMYIFGGNWIGPTQFGVSNTTWAATNNIAFSTASKLTSVLSNTLISIPSTGSNSIYFGLRVPGGTNSGTYQQIITFENSC